MKPRPHCRSRRGHRGVGLFDALVALAILAFGLLAMTRFQGRMVAQTTETQSRQLATQLAAQHLSTVLVDTGNAACYTVPATGTCSNSAAAARSADWAASAAAALPAPASAVAVLDSATNRMTVTLSWKSRDAMDRNAADLARTLTAITDVR